MTEELKNEFPVTTEYTYLNTASCGLLSSALVDWRRQHDLHLLEGGSVFRDLHKAHIKEIRQSVARFFSSEEEEVALVPNFSFGINVLLDGIPSGKKVLLLEGDYPSVNWPFERRDFDVCFAQIDEHMEQNISEAIEKHRPDILAFSVVQYISGIRMDLDFIKTLKEKHPEVLIIADGTQFLGTTNFNFQESGIDVLGGSCYKWMLSGYGNAVFMVRKEMHHKIFPNTVGFNSVDAQFSRKNDIEFVGHLEPGHQDTLNYGSLGNSIKWMEQVGKDVIEGHLKTLSIAAKDAFANLNLLDEKTMNRNQHSTIFNIKGDQKIFNRLKEHQVICSLRGNGMRVSFHLYNTLEDIQKLVSVLEKD
jgi:selenocysteine lyase/cysteine desulfurase